jgi:hypothetical protein
MSKTQISTTFPDSNTIEEQYECQYLAPREIFREISYEIYTTTSVINRSTANSDDIANMISNYIAGSNTIISNTDSQPYHNVERPQHQSTTVIIQEDTDQGPIDISEESVDLTGYCQS